MARVHGIASRLTGTTGVAVAVGVGASLVRLPRALTDPLWQDEVASARILREPSVRLMLRHVARTESTPPLWYTLAWLVHRAGVSIHDVRLLSVGCGGLLAGMVVVFARGVMPLRHAALAGLLVGVGGEFVAHGRELRAYELFTLLTIVFALLLDAEIRSPSLARALGLAACTAAGSLTHYFFLFTVAAGLVWTWIEPQARQARRQATLAVVLGLALCLPWSPELLRQYHQHRFSWIGGFNAPTVLNTVLRLFTPLPRPGIAADAVGAIVLGAACWGGLALSRQSARGRLITALLLVPFVLASSAWLVGLRVYSVRNMIGIGAFAAVALAGACAALPTPARSAVAAVVACLVIGVFVWDQRTPSAPYNGIAHALVKEGWRVSDPVAILGDLAALRSPLEWYLPGLPTLSHVSAGRATCGTLFAVEARSARHLLRGPAAQTDVGRYDVLRFRRAPEELPPDANVLATRAGTHCV